MYKFQRNYENLNKAIYDGAGQYGIPIIEPAYPKDLDSWIRFNDALSCKTPEKMAVHFYTDDYRFSRLWAAPDTYIPALRNFKAVCTPDFSMYTDFPVAAQIWNHYRKHWLGAYWQEHGITVIPTIGWSNEDSFEWCFDGEPTHSVVSVSSIGVQVNSEAARLFKLGYDEMLRRLEPTRVYFMGKIPEGIGGPIIRIPTQWEMLKRARTFKNNGKEYDEQSCKMQEGKL